MQALKSGIGDIFGKNQASEKDICSWLYNGKDYKIEYNYVLDITEPYQNVLMAYGQGIDTQRYTYGLDIVSLDTWNKSVDIWTAETIAPVTSQKSDQNYYLQDELGSPIRIVGQAGNTKAIYSYDAFGRPILPVSFISQCRSKSNIYSYTGYQYDIPTALIYAQARYYTPEVGRFISEDSVKGNLTNPVSLNSYVYVKNNPLIYVDPSGLVSKKTASNIIKTNAQYIKNAALTYGVNPRIVAGCIYSEQVLNVDFRDAATDWVGYYGLLDTSVGIGQVKMSTAKFLEDMGYITKASATEGGWNVPFIGFVCGTETMAREKRLENNEQNVMYVAANFYG